MGKKLKDTYFLYAICHLDIFHASCRNFISVKGRSVGGFQLDPFSLTLAMPQGNTFLCDLHEATLRSQRHQWSLRICQLITSNHGNFRENVLWHVPVSGPFNFLPPLPGDPSASAEIHTVDSFIGFRLCTNGTFSVRPCQVCLPKIVFSASLCPHTPLHPPLPALFSL